MGLDIGRYRINVTYEGDDTYESQTNYTYFNVTKAALDVTVIALNVTVEENASFIIFTPSDFNGKVNAVDASIVLSYYAYRGSGGTIADMREWLK
jgi:hypothetical protein